MEFGYVRIRVVLDVVRTGFFYRFFLFVDFVVLGFGIN